MQLWRAAPGHFVDAEHTKQPKLNSPSVPLGGSMVSHVTASYRRHADRLAQ